MRIVIPVRDPAEGKTRLAPVLAPAEREALNRGFYRHVLDIALQVALASRIHVISRSAWVLQIAAAAGANAIAEQATGLNAALEQVAATIGRGAPLLTLSTDLPLLGAEDLAALATHSEKTEVVAACDRAGCGTNALLLRRPGLISYRYGPGSLAAHRLAAAGRAAPSRPRTRPATAVLRAPACTCTASAARAA